jgi:hypothetical protein
VVCDQCNEILVAVDPGVMLGCCAFTLYQHHLKDTLSPTAICGRRLAVLIVVISLV